MQRYREFQPTGFDSKGLALEDQQDWLVVPCGRNRDSSVLDESNFACALKQLGGVSDAVEVHRFGHWACGWFEIIIVKPDTDEAHTAEEIESCLSDYPVLDDSDFSEREYKAASEVWERMRIVDRIPLAHKYRFHLMACRRDSLPICNNEGDLIEGDLIAYLAE